MSPPDIFVGEEGRKDDGKRVTNIVLQRFDFTRFLLGKMLVLGTTAQAAHLLPKAKIKVQLCRRVAHCYKLTQALLTHGQALHCSIINDVGVFISRLP